MGGRDSRRPGAAHDASNHTLSSCMRRVCVRKAFPHAGASNEAVRRFQCGRFLARGSLGEAGDVFFSISTMPRDFKLLFSKSQSPYLAQNTLFGRTM